MIENRSINVLSVIYSNIYFPTYTNELKDVGKYLGCHWDACCSTGIQSLVLRSNWEKLNDTAIQCNLIKYNRIDCVALKQITEFLYKISETISEQLPANHIAFVDHLQAEDKFSHPFGKCESAIKDYNLIVKSAYFNYQRNKIYFRTDDRIRTINRRIKKNRSNSKLKFNCRRFV